MIDTLSDILFTVAILAGLVLDNAADPLDKAMTLENPVARDIVACLMVCWNPYLVVLAEVEAAMARCSSVAVEAVVV